MSNVSVYLKKKVPYLISFTTVESVTNQYACKFIGVHNYS